MHEMKSGKIRKSTPTVGAVSYYTETRAIQAIHKPFDPKDYFRLLIYLRLSRFLSHFAQTRTDQKRLKKLIKFSFLYTTCVLYAVWPTTTNNLKIVLDLYFVS